MVNEKLQRFDNEGLELIINTQTGESYASVSGYARMSGKPRTTIQSRINKIKGDDNVTSFEAQIQTPGGTQWVTIIPEDLIVEWIVKDNPDIATKLMKVGVRVYLHTLAGFTVTSTATAKELSPLEILEQQVRLMRQQQEDLGRVKLQIQQFNEFKQEIEDTQKEAITQLKALPQATCVVLPIAQKELLNRLIRDYSLAKCLSYGYVYNWVYREFRDRYHIDLKVRGNNNKPKLSGIEYADKNKLTDKLYAVAQEVLVV